MRRHPHRPRARACPDTPRHLDRPQPEPGRVPARDASERPRRRLERQLVVAVARRRPPLGHVLPGPVSGLRARDADRPQPDPGLAAAGDDLVPPAHESRLGLGTEYRRRRHLCARRPDALLPPPLAARHRHQLAKPPPARLGLVHCRAAGRHPLAATGTSPGGCSAGSRRRCSRPRARLTASRLKRAAGKIGVILRVLAPAVSFLVLGLPVGASVGTSQLRTEPLGWTIRAERLIGRLPVSVSVAEGGRLVYTHTGNRLRAPASDEKLLLSMALLDRFGARYRIPTTIEGAPCANGVVKGNLWLVGHGDPELNDAALERLAHKLRASGIRTVRGSVIGATNTFTRERWAPGWHPIAL